MTSALSNVSNGLMEITRTVLVAGEKYKVNLSGSAVRKNTQIVWEPIDNDSRSGRFKFSNLNTTGILEGVSMGKVRKPKVRLFKKAKGRTLYIGKTVRKDGDGLFVLTHQKSGRKISYESVTRAKKDGWVEVK